jgi:hypothetical protein
VNGRTAQRYAPRASPRYRQRERLAELTEAQLAHVVRRLDRSAELRATIPTGSSSSSGTELLPSLARRVRAIRPPTRTVDPLVRFDPGAGPLGRLRITGSLPPSFERCTPSSEFSTSRMVVVRFARCDAPADSVSARGESRGPRRRPGRGPVRPRPRPRDWGDPGSPAGFAPHDLAEGRPSLVATFGHNRSSGWFRSQFKVEPAASRAEKSSCGHSKRKAASDTSRDSIGRETIAG